jgi:sugar O-acyltransferase (sialic acid O-acetyltransferase NeuD family)
MAKVVIFGVQDFASLAHFYLRTDSEHDVVGFSVDAEHTPENRRFEGLPVVPFDEVEQVWPSTDFSFFAPVSHRNMNNLRRQVLARICAKGYAPISYISSRATVFANTTIGRNCFILENNTIQPFVTIGDNCVLWSGNHIGHHSRVGNHVFFTSHVVLSGHCNVGDSCSFGVNSTIRDGLDIGEGTFLAMASSLTRSTEPYGVYKGNPATRSKLDSRSIC